VRSIQFRRWTVPLGTGEARAGAYRRAAPHCSEVVKKSQKHRVGAQTYRHSTSSSSLSRVSKAE
jgi:hypothetical protein